MEAKGGAAEAAVDMEDPSSDDLVEGANTEAVVQAGGRPVRAHAAGA